MGRGRVELKRIENKINRQVTFSKRRSGIFKKAQEISVLCDAQVGLIIFSHRGKLFDFSSESCMEKVLERYERYSYAERQLASNESDTQVNWTFDYAKLKAKLDLLQRNHRHYMGQDLDPLNMKELQSLEQQLDTALKHIRTRKNQLMHESISQLQKKERAMQEQNNVLAKKIKERGNNNTQVEEMQWQQQQNQQHASNNNNNEASDYLLQNSLPASLNIRNNNSYQQGEVARNNELDLSLQPIYSCNMDCFTN